MSWGRPSQKIEAIATKIYGADGVDYHYEANAAIERFTRLGYATLPICMAKTQASLSDDKTKIGRPRDWRLTVREIGCRRVPGWWFRSAEP